MIDDVLNIETPNRKRRNRVSAAPSPSKPTPRPRMGHMISSNSIDSTNLFDISTSKVPPVDLDADSSNEDAETKRQEEMSPIWKPTRVTETATRRAMARSISRS